MAHAIWTGSINFGLVTIPVKLFTAVREASDLHFHFLHNKDMGRIKNERVCSECGKKVAWDDIARGYEYERGQYVIVTDEDFKKANVEATQSVDIVEFVKADQVDPMLYDKPYFLEPEKKGRHAYALLREALKESGKVGVARVVLRSREHIALLRPRDPALVLELMHWGDEIVDASTLEFPAVSEKMPGPEMKAATMLIDAMTKEFDAAEFHDTYREQLLKLIEARAHGEALPRSKAKAPRANVLDLMDVLEKSLAATKSTDKPTEKPARSKGITKAGPRAAARHGRKSAA